MGVSVRKPTHAIGEGKQRSAHGGACNTHEMLETNIHVLSERRLFSARHMPPSPRHLNCRLARPPVVSGDSRRPAPAVNPLLVTPLNTLPAAMCEATRDDEQAVSTLTAGPLKAKV